MAKENSQLSSEAAQVGRFGLVGILSFVIDFALFNIITKFILDSNTSYIGGIHGIVIASVISGTIAMINSFVFNLRFTFRAKKISTAKTVAFFVLTALGIYVIRPIIVSFFTDKFVWPANTAYSIAQALHLPFSRTFINNNVGLLAAVAVVLVYNYLVYKEIIFKK